MSSSGQLARCLCDDLTITAGFKHYYFTLQGGCICCYISGSVKAVVSAHLFCDFML